MEKHEFRSNLLEFQSNSLSLSLSPSLDERDEKRYNSITRDRCFVELVPLFFHRCAVSNNHPSNDRPSNPAEPLPPPAAETTTTTTTPSSRRKSKDPSRGRGFDPPRGNWIGIFIDGVAEYARHICSGIESWGMDGNSIELSGREFAGESEFVITSRGGNGEEER